MNWRKSSYSMDSSNCVEVVWTSSRTCQGGGCVEVVHSRRCDSGACVQVAVDADRVLVRDSKRGDDSPVIGFTPSGWRSFVAAAVAWDRESTFGVAGVWLSRLSDVVTEDVCLFGDDLQHLHFTDAEWDAFVTGAKAGEFDRLAGT